VRALMSSPRLVLCFFRLQLLEGMFAIVLWLVALPAAGLWYMSASQPEGVGSEEARPGGWASPTVALACVVLLHWLLLAARLPDMVSLFARSEQLVERDSAAYCMKGLLHCRTQSILHCVSAFLLICYSTLLVMPHASLIDPSTCHLLMLSEKNCLAMVGVQRCVCELSLSLTAIALAMGFTCSGALSPHQRHVTAGEIMYRVDAREFPCYRFEQSSDDGDVLTCVICAADVEPGDVVRKMQCGHIFHGKCIDTWLRHSPSCPMRCHCAIKFEVVDRV